MRHIAGRWKNGDWSPDGTKRFWAYGPIRKDGTRGERWMTPERWQKHHDASAENTRRYRKVVQRAHTQARIDNRVRTRAGKPSRLKPGFIADVQRHLSRGRDIGRIATFMGIPTSRIQAAIDYIHANHVHVSTHGAEREVSSEARREGQAGRGHRVHQPGADACAHQAQG